MKIAFITGSYPPDTCGIGDYTCQLVQALSAQRVHIEVVRRDSWSIGNAADVIRSVKELRTDLVHIQYPTAGFGWHLTPQILAAAIPAVVTLHEVSHAHVLRKLSLYPFTLRSLQVIFTTEFERAYAVRRAPWIAGRSSVIPIGSAIATACPEQGTTRNPGEIVYFGLFRPNKGIEEVMTLASLLRARGLAYQVRMIGKASASEPSYYQELRQRSRELPMIWDVDLSDGQIAEKLAGASLAYMPFPDGASGRRSSLLALMANGVIVITTRGDQTPSSLEGSVLFVERPEQVIPHLDALRRDVPMRDLLSRRSLDYAEQFTWSSIARRHRELYEKVLSETAHTGYASPRK